MTKELQVTDKVLVKVEKLQETGALMLPQNYHAGNNVKAANLLLQDLTNKNGKYALEVCTQSSIANAIFYMVTNGLSPTKHQCSFIIRGNKLTCQKEYAGNIAIAKRDSDLIGIPKAYTIYEGDKLDLTIDLETGLQKVSEYKPNIDNIKKEKIKGALAIARFSDGTTDCLYMPLEQIHAAWKMGSAKGNSPAHNDFPDQMCEKTAINRLLKRYINSSDDSELGVVQAFEPNKKNTETIDVDDAFQEAEEVKPETEKEVDTEPEKEPDEQIQDIEFTDTDEPEF
jgi:recombination protein RecT